MHTGEIKNYTQTVLYSIIWSSDFLYKWWIEALCYYTWGWFTKRVENVNLAYWIRRIHVHMKYSILKEIKKTGFFLAHDQISEENNAS